MIFRCWSILKKGKKVFTMRPLFINNKFVTDFLDMTNKKGIYVNG